MQSICCCVKKLVFLLFLFLSIPELPAQNILVDGQPGQLNIREAGPVSVRITLKPISFEEEFPATPVLVDKKYPKPVLSLKKVSKPVKKSVGLLSVEVTNNPLTVKVFNSNADQIQEINFLEDGKMTFSLDEEPVLGMGEGGPKPDRSVNWRTLPVEFDRRGRLHNMYPRWQSDAYGSRNPVAMLLGTKGWGLFVTTPWGQIDLRNKKQGTYIPVEQAHPDSMQQSKDNQHENLGKGIPPFDGLVKGLYDIFVFDTRDPAAFMKDVSLIGGKAVMPPKWALGYMQSHRTLENDSQMVEIVHTFRKKEIPLDAVIYLGTGFTPRGWNTEQPSFQFNPEVFQNDPEEVIQKLQDQQVKFIVHMVPWDRDKLPTLHGTIPPLSEERLDESHIQNYWEQHVPLVKSGIDAWWPDEGDWFNLFERMKRHQMYYQGPLSTQPNRRPWSLHRNGHLGIAKWGGWVWSGDTDASWKSLEAQIAVGINHSLSLSPFWGSDIGGFYPNKELTGDLYVRWFQFGAFTSSFRSHGRTWWTRLPWGWGLSELGPLESRTPPDESALNDQRIEPIAKKYARLRYQLLSYNYTLAWEARNSGMPMMRAMWLHYPNDKVAVKKGDQYLWGKDVLVAPVYEKNAEERIIYLPVGNWYDWWTKEKTTGGKLLTRKVDLATMPVYARAGAIIPIDPVRQYTEEEVDGPIIIRVYTGANGEFVWYEDDGISQEYLSGQASLTRIRWNEAERVLTVEPFREKEYHRPVEEKKLRVELVPESKTREVLYSGKPLRIKIDP